MDRIAPEYVRQPAKEVFRVAGEEPANGRLVLLIKGTTIEGEDIEKTVAVNLAAANPDGRKRLADAGLTITALGDSVQIAAVKFGSRAKKSGFEQGFEVAGVQVRNPRPNPHWFYLPALALLALVWWAQGRRMRLRTASA
jgi:hypothetical protein